MKNILHLTLLLALCACFHATAAETPEERAKWLDYTRAHVFMVDSDGRYRDAAEKWGLCTRTNDLTRPQQVASISNHLAQFVATNHSPDRRVVVFIHGGMNPVSASYKRLQRLTEPMLTNNCYPLFIVWDSGLGGSYWEHLVSVRQGERRPIIGPITSPFVLVSDLAKGIARFPLTLAGRIENDARIVELPEGKRATRWELFENTIADNRPDQVFPPAHEGRARGWGERTGQTITYFLTLPLKIGFLPILDGVGTESWDLMQRRTQTMFWPPLNYEFYNSKFNDPGYDLKQSDEDIKNWLARKPGKDKLSRDTAVGGMYEFSRRLLRWTTNDFKSLPFEFYGHSMGTLVLNELFRVAPDIATTNIVYLGAACTIRGFEQSVLPYLRRHPNAHFYNVSLHRIRERIEASFYDLPPRGSLLNWIDDIFEKPKNVSDRTLGTWENIVRTVPDIPDDLIARTHMRALDVEPFYYFMKKPNQAQSHGDFTNFPFWQPAYYWHQPGKAQPTRLATAEK